MSGCNRIRNDYNKESLNITPIDDELRKTHLRWFEYLIRRPNTARVHRVVRLQIVHIRSKGRLLTTWNSRNFKKKTQKT